jgi:hypothetical protein
LDAYTFPVTCVDVENTPEASATNENPVIAVAAMGLTPMSPVTTEFGTVEIPDFARITKLPAVPRSTGAGPAAGGAGLERCGEAAVGALMSEVPPSPVPHPATKATSRNAINPITEYPLHLFIFDPPLDYC